MRRRDQWVAVHRMRGTSLAAHVRAFYRNALVLVGMSRSIRRGVMDDTAIAPRARRGARTSPFQIFLYGEERVDGNGTVESVCGVWRNAQIT